VLWPEGAGVFQRAMFVLTYVWLMREMTEEAKRNSKHATPRA
jgi:hypothetical protein